MRAAFAAFALAACSIPTKTYVGPGTPDAPNGTFDAPNGTPDAASPDGPDAPMPDAGAPFSCSGQPLPTTAPANITISGLVSSIDISGNSPVSGAALSGHAFGITESFGTTDASGNFSATIPTGNMPVDGYISVTDASYMETDAYPSEPFDKNSSFSIVMITSQLLGEAGSFAGVTVDSSKAQLLIGVIDCNGMPVQGATVSTSPAGTVRYLSGNIPSSSATSTDSTGGAIVFNVPPGAITINGTAQGFTLRAHTVTGVTGNLTNALLQP